MDWYINPENLNERTTESFRYQHAARIAEMMEAYAAWKAAGEHFQATRCIKSLNQSIKLYEKLNDAAQTVSVLWHHRR